MAKNFRAVCSADEISWKVFTYSCSGMKSLFGTSPVAKDKSRTRYQGIFRHKKTEAVRLRFYNLLQPTSLNPGLFDSCAIRFDGPIKLI
jgi:hypothetical protein